MSEPKRSIRHALSRALFFWPTAAAIALGRGLISLSDTAGGRVLLAPILRAVGRFILYARSLPILRPRSQQAMPPDVLNELLVSHEEIAVIPCACRATTARCDHPLHGPHESATCLSFGLAATLQRMSGLGQKVTVEEAQRICNDAAASGMVHHAIMTFGLLVEVCSCCVESCTVFAAYHRGLTNVVRPSGLMPVRTDDCDGCSGKAERMCVEICPYDEGPGSDGCVGCGLCAVHCPRQAIQMTESTGAS